MDDNIRGFPGYHITKEGKLYRYGKLPRLIGKNNPCYGLRGSKNPNAKLNLRIG